MFSVMTHTQTQIHTTHTRQTHTHTHTHMHKLQQHINYINKYRNCTIEYTSTMYRCVPIFWGGFYGLKCANNYTYIYTAHKHPCTRTLCRQQGTRMPTSHVVDFDHEKTGKILQHTQEKRTTTTHLMFCILYMKS
jgi:hypothetical protein